MLTTSVTVNRLSEHVLSDDRRVITRQFVMNAPGRMESLLQRILDLHESAVTTLLSRVRRDFGHRHKNLDRVFEEHFREVAQPLIAAPDQLSPARRKLIGAYFTKEYSIEAAALFNPSIVPHPDQSDLPAGTVRFIMSLRATGEGHVSSVAFRTGVIKANGDVLLHRTSRFVEAARKVKDRVYHKHTFVLKLMEMGVHNLYSARVLEHLGEEFVYEKLLAAIDSVEADDLDAELVQATASRIRWLARSNYHLTFPEDCDVSEVVLFPVTENETCGIEDARFVRFVDEDESAMYYATYTAYNGVNILPMLLETPDFHHFRINTLNGQYAQNKGAALFPRKVSGLYCMISRVDGENLYVMWSPNIRFWNEASVLQVPTYPWEFVQIGNCGSPLETPEGWLLLTHGVGPMREYCIGATLLDLEDPTRIIGQLEEPLLAPNEQEREGYVPNVVYTCGALIHNDVLFMPYAMSDSATSIATIPVQDLLDRMRRGRPGSPRSADSRALAG